MQRLFGRAGRIVDKDWDDIEEALLGADVGVATTAALLEAVRKKVGAFDESHNHLKSLLSKEALALFEGLSVVPRAHGTAEKPWVVSVIGVNGVGKTTTVGKLCSVLSREGKSVLIGAADTFRAAAVQQLRVWADRSQSDFVAGREGGDSAAIAFDAVSAGVARGKDVVIIDTAGRLHTKANLIEELKKVHRVMKKVLPDAPHEVLLVVDGTLGQNSAQQARLFSKELGVTGIVITKLDGTAKGGAVLAIASEFKLPIRYVGVGEGKDDLIPFQAEQFVQALIG